MAQAIRYISAKSLIAKFVSDFNIESDVRVQDMIEWIGEACEKIGATIQHEAKVATLEVEGHRVYLPCELQFIEHVYLTEARHRDAGIALTEATNVPAATLGQQDEDEIHKDVEVNPSAYSVQWPYLIVGYKTGKVKVFYRAIPVDEEGFPKVVDHIDFKEAVNAYLLYKLKSADYFARKMGFQEWQLLEQNAFGKIDKARANISFPSPDKAQSIVHQWNQLIPNLHSYKDLHVTDAIQKEF